jgi:tetratricopeptide (TPR) repeat protein
VHDLKLPPWSEAQGYREQPFGVLASIPLVWMAWAVPLAWRSRSAEARSILRGFLAAATLLFATRALSLGLFYAAFVRYEWEFCPVLVLMAVVGILSLERAMAGWPAWRRAARWAWSLLLAFSLAFNLLASTIYHADYHSKSGSVLVQRGQVNEGIAHYQEALALRPDDAMTHYDLGSALGRKGQTDEAIHEFQEALRLKPDYAEAHNNLGGALGQKGQIDEAIRQFQETLRLKPEQAEAHYNLAVALRQKGQTDEAIHQLQETLRLRPEHVQAHNSLGSALYQRGRAGEAIREFQEALRLKPDYAEARKNLIVALAAQANPASLPGSATNR